MKRIQGQKENEEIVKKERKKRMRGDALDCLQQKPEIRFPTDTEFVALEEIREDCLFDHHSTDQGPLSG